MDAERDYDAIATWDRGDSGSIGRATGPRREPPALCPACGEDVRDPSLFGDPTCGAPKCRDAAARRPVDPWLVRTGVRA